jgi:hypothetical protein
MTDETMTQGMAPGNRPPRGRGLRVIVALAVVLLSCALVGVANQSAGVAATATPACTIAGSLAGKPLVTNVTQGESIGVSCTGLSDVTPYLFVTTSLLLAIDPAAAPLLTGQATSVPGLLSIIDALPVINAASASIVTSNLSGGLTTNYTVPTTQALDPNAVCPPTTEQINSGLIGCAVAMIDLTTFKPVTAGTFVLEYKGDPLFPPSPTLALSAKVANAGQSVSVSDAPGATTYWWMATLSALDALLSGSTGGPADVTVMVGAKKAVSTATVTPASYSDSVFTPPKLSGTFVATKRRGKHVVTVLLSADLLGFFLSNVATQKLKIVH